MAIIYFLLFSKAVLAPSKYVLKTNFCFYAELVPEREQVVFWKSTAFSLFGNHPIKIEVSIRDLEKVSADVIKGGDYLFRQNINIDSDFVWMCQKSGEVFVFDKQGLWNKEALEHPLLY